MSQYSWHKSKVFPPFQISFSVLSHSCCPLKGIHTMEKLSTGKHAVQEEKREIKPWSVEEKRLFYEAFNKHYRKYSLIHQMVSYRSKSIIYLAAIA